MAYLTKKEFAEQTVGTTRQLAVYIKRGKVVVRKDDLIDTNNATNKAFIAKYGIGPVGKGGIPKYDEPVVEITDDPDNTHTVTLGDLIEKVKRESAAEDAEIMEEEGERLLPVQLSQKKYQHYLADKTKKAAALDDLKIQKLKGEVIPVGPVETLVFQFKQYSLTQMKIALEKILGEFAHKYKVSPEDLAYYRGLGVKALNEATRQATDDFVKGFDIKLNEYTSKRARGERG